jgi:hypothetical protein
MTKRFLAALPLAALVALAGCVPPAPEPTPAPAPAPRPQPSAAPTTIPTDSSWMDLPQTPGDWFYAAIPPYTYAAFGPAATRSMFSIRCDRARGLVSLGRTSAAPAPRPMTIRTETAARAFTAQPEQGSAEHLVKTDLPAFDKFLEAIAFSKGRFAVEVAGEPPLYLPSWPEISRVIEDCR